MQTSDAIQAIISVALLWGQDIPQAINIMVLIKWSTIKSPQTIIKSTTFLSGLLDPH